MGSTSTEIAYCDPVESRRTQVLAALGEVGRQVTVFREVLAVPRDARLVVLGVTDLAATLPLLRWLHDERLERPVLLLWDGTDHALTLEAVRAGVRDVVASPEAVPAAIVRAWSLLAGGGGGGRRRAGKVVAIYSLKGGIGKSTLAANLAITMQRLSAQRWARRTQRRAGDRAPFLRRRLDRRPARR